MPNKVNYRNAEIPPCCGNCDLNEWDEDGPLCISDGEGGKLENIEDMFDEEDARVGWEHVCNYHVEEKKASQVMSAKDPPQMKLV